VSGNFYHLSTFDNKEVLNPGITGVAASSSANVFIAGIDAFQSQQRNLKSLSSIS
jgi:hypothetical protein